MPKTTEHTWPKKQALRCNIVNKRYYQSENRLLVGSFPKKIKYSSLNKTIFPSALKSPAAADFPCDKLS